MPSILIPSPYVPNNHQYFKALALVNEKAAIMLEEKDLSASSLNKLVSEIINDDNKLEELSKNALKLANTSAIGDIICEIEKL